MASLNASSWAWGDWDWFLVYLVPVHKNNKQLLEPIIKRVGHGESRNVEICPMTRADFERHPHFVANFDGGHTFAYAGCEDEHLQNESRAFLTRQKLSWEDAVGQQHGSYVLMLLPRSTVA